MPTSWVIDVLAMLDTSTLTEPAICQQPPLCQSPFPHMAPAHLLPRQAHPHHLTPTTLPSLTLPDPVIPKSLPHPLPPTAVLTPTIMVSVSVFATLALTSPTVPALLVLPVWPMPVVMPMVHAHAIPASPITLVSAPSALREPSGVPQLESVSSSADKTQPTLPLPMPVSATLDSVFFPAHARPVLMDTSSPTDIA